MTIKPRRQFGDPARPLWGQSFDQFQHHYRVDYDAAARDVALELAQDDPAIKQLAQDLHDEYNERNPRGGLGELGIYELLAKLGILLNEIATVEERERKYGHRLATAIGADRVR